MTRQDFENHFKVLLTVSIFFILVLNTFIAGAEKTFGKELVEQFPFGFLLPLKYVLLPALYVLTYGFYASGIWKSKAGFGDEDRVWSVMNFFNVTALFGFAGELFNASGVLNLPGRWVEWITYSTLGVIFASVLIQLIGVLFMRFIVDLRKK